MNKIVGIFILNFFICFLHLSDSCKQFSVNKLAYNFFALWLTMHISLLNHVNLQLVLEKIMQSFCEVFFGMLFILCIVLSALHSVLLQHNNKLLRFRIVYSTSPQNCNWSRKENISTYLSSNKIFFSRNWHEISLFLRQWWRKKRVI